MKRISRIICVLMAFVMSISIPAAAFEIDNSAPYASGYFGSHSAYLSKTSGSSFQVWFTVTAVRGMTKLGVEYIDVERSTDGVNWSVVKTYDSSDYPSLIATNTSGHSGYVTYSNMQSSYEYRAYVSFYAKNSSGTASYGTYAYF